MPVKYHTNTEIMFPTYYLPYYRYYIPNANIKFILNRTTGEYFEYKINDNKYIHKISELLRKQNRDTCIITDDCNASHWQRTDHIVYVPTHLEQHVVYNYTKIYSI